jgi:hypothetical protein
MNARNANDIRVLFMVGVKGTGEYLEKVQTEAHKFGDIIQVLFHPK